MRCGREVGEGLLDARREAEEPGMEERRWSLGIGMCGCRGWDQRTWDRSGVRHIPNGCSSPTSSVRYVCSWANQHLDPRVSIR
jgi:hypothetical protein